MKVYKPHMLGLSTRPIGHGGRFGLCVSATLNFGFDAAGACTPMTDLSLWPFLAEEMPDGPMIDEGVAKTQAEFLVHGRAYAPRGADGLRAGACAVRARLGDTQKTVLVHGDRIWEGEQPSRAAPCDGIALDWSRAYGGADFAANPLGRGRLPVAGAHLLPNLERPDDRALRPGQAIAPAALGRVDPLWPQRAVHRGTYDDAWFRTLAPGFAADIDWRYFNLASPDQWLAQPLCGDESFELHHMHPEHVHLRGTLPGLRARVFADLRQPGEGALKEVPLRLTTVWFFPHALRAALVFQGLQQVKEDDDSEVAGLMGAVERLEAPRSTEHYGQAWQRRQDPAMGGLHALRESDLLPDGMRAGDAYLEASQRSLAVEGLQAQAQQRRAQLQVEAARQDAIEQGIDPDALGIRLPEASAQPTIDELPDYLMREQARSQAALRKTLDDAARQILEAEDEALRAGIDPARLVHRGPPQFRADEALAAWLGAQPPAVAGNAAEVSRLGAQFARAQDAHRQSYLEIAHAQAPALRMDAAQAQALRAEITQAHARGMRLDRIDLTGADLSGLDLRGADFTGAWLESANLAASNLSGAKFDAAVLAHADLSGALALGASFRQANLGRATLQGAVLERADLRGAMLMHTRIDGVQLRLANLSGAQLLESVWGTVDATEAIAEAQTFVKLDLRRVNWEGAQLSRSNFVQCDMRATNLSAAWLDGAVFATCEAGGARLAGASLTGAAFVEGSDLAGADLRGARCAKANLAATSLCGAQCAGAVFQGANLRLADLRDAQLSGVDLRDALLVRARLDRADLRAANLMDAVAQNATLRGADLRHANLHGIDMSRVRLDGATRLEGGLLTRARTWPRLTPGQQAALAAEDRARDVPAQGGAP